MEQSILTLPQRVNVTCLEDLGLISVKEVKKFAELPREKVRLQAALVLCDFVLFCCMQNRSIDIDDCSVLGTVRLPAGTPIVRGMGIST